MTSVASETGAVPSHLAAWKENIQEKHECFMSGDGVLSIE